jgi:hypothetical protein
MAHHFWHHIARVQFCELLMGRPPLENRIPLVERLNARAATLQPDKAAKTISKIIEVRAVLAEQKMRGLSWAALTDLLESEGVSLAEGTLRNYMRMIGQAEAAMRAGGNMVPSDQDIRAALHIRQGANAARQKPSPLLSHGELQKFTPPPSSTPSMPVARSSIIRNPDPDL